MKQNAHINPELLKWARKSINLSLSLASEKIGVQETTLVSWENGEENPTIKQLYKIAEVYKRPFAILNL